MGYLRAPAVVTFTAAAIEQATAPHPGTAPQRPPETPRPSAPGSPAPQTAAASHSLRGSGTGSGRSPPAPPTAISLTQSHLGRVQRSTWLVFVMATQLNFAANPTKL